MPGTGPPRRFVVALVSSAGGLDALTQVLNRLPTDLPAAVVALQHTDPERESVLADLLSRRTALTVTVASDGAGLDPGIVLVAPSGSHMLITSRRTVCLVPSGAFPPSRPSADLLLTTLALAYGPDSIAVVLSGGGHDAATGATVIQHLGGTVLATDQATSEHYGMPGNTATRNSTAVVLPLPDVADLIVDLVTRSQL
jgi:two-component system chemotaxis response regulator CheB